MQDTVNWGALFDQGRCFGIGIPWTEEQAKARAAGVPAEHVREGILTMEGYDKALKAAAKAREQDQVAVASGKPLTAAQLKRQKLADLKVLAAGKGIDFDTTAVSKESLVQAILAKQAGSESAQ